MQELATDRQASAQAPGPHLASFSILIAVFVWKLKWRFCGLFINIASANRKVQENEHFFNCLSKIGHLNAYFWILTLNSLVSSLYKVWVYETGQMQYGLFMSIDKEISNEPPVKFLLFVSL